MSVNPIRVENFNDSSLIPEKVKSKVIELQARALESSNRDGDNKGFIYTVYTPDEIDVLMSEYGGRVYIIRKNDKILGFALTTDIRRFNEYMANSEWESAQPVDFTNYRYIEQMVIRDDFRGEGIGSSLFDIVLAEESNLVADISIEPKINHEAERFLIRHLFHPVGMMKNLNYRGRTLTFQAWANLLL